MLALDESLCSKGASAREFGVESPRKNRQRSLVIRQGCSHDLERYLVRVASAARERRKHVIDAISTPQGILERQKVVTEEIWKMLGGPFERTPLNPRVTGTVERRGYRIEKLAFESRPRLYVTANLVDVIFMIAQRSPMASCDELRPTARNEDRAVSYLVDDRMY